MTAMNNRTHESRGMVLIVEDDLQLAAGTRNRLEREGFTCRVADTLESAFRRLSADRPDLIISDFNLPDGTADDLLRALPAEPDAPPVLLCTAAPRSVLGYAAAHPLVYRVLTKPVPIRSLLDAVAERIPFVRDPLSGVRPLVGAPERRQLLGELPCG